VSGKLPAEVPEQFKELEALKNKYNGFQPPKSSNEILNPVLLQKHLRSNKGTNGSFLHSLATTPNHPLQPLAKALLEAANTKELNVPIIHDSTLDKTEEVRSHYDLQTDEIRLGTQATTDSRVVMEEVAHSLTAKKIPNFKGTGEEYYNGLQFYLKHGTNPHIKDLINSYIDTIQALGQHEAAFGKNGFAGDANEAAKTKIGFGATTKYAMGSLDEHLVQALKDPQYQNVLARIPTNDGRTVWQTIVDAVKNLLGLDAKSGSMLERVLRTSGEIVKMDRPEIRSAGEYSIQHPEKEGGNYTVTHKPTGEIIYKGKSWDEAHNAVGQDSHALIFRPPLKEGERVEPETSSFLGKAGRFFQNTIERARKVSPEVADAYHRYFNGRSEIYGAVYGRVKNVMNATHFTKLDGDRLMEAMRLEERTKAQVPMGFFHNQAQKQVWNEYKKAYREQGLEAIKDKQPVYDYNQHQFRIRKLSDVSHPLMLNPKVGEILRDNTNTEAVNKLRQDFLADQKSRGIGLDNAKENLETTLNAIQGMSSKTGDTGSFNHFNANRRAAGTPLPDSWTRQDFEQNLRTYASRNASDRAHYKYIESNPEVMSQLGEKKDAWGNKIPETSKPKVAGNQFIQTLIKESKGEVGPQGFYTERAGSSAATAVFISSPALSGVHVPIANLVGAVGMARNPFQASRLLWSGLRGMVDGQLTANKNGVMVPTARAVSDTWNPSLTHAERFQAFASIVRRISTFNDLITKANIGFMQSAMERLVIDKAAIAAGSGRKAITAQQWLRKLDPDYTVGKQFTDEEIQKQASRAVGYLHGTNDPRSMPEWMLRDSEISGFFSIAHWSVAQTDRFMRDVWTPATKGDLSPLCMTLFGSAVGGYIIKELREKISGKHSPIPSIAEIQASDRGLKGNAGPLAYNMIAAMQYAGFGGVFSQMAKWPFDFAYKNIPQAAAFPLDEEISDLGKTVADVSSAIANDPNINYVDLAKLVTGHLLTSDFRLGREGYNQMINHGLIDGTLAEKKELSDKLGQLRRFEQVEGLPYPAQLAGGDNPYYFPEQKAFKMEQNIPKAIKELPALVSNIMEQNRANPDVMMQKLKALKENSYATFPSMEDTPISFMKYLGYLQREEGPEAANAELMDYYKHKITNEVKGSVVP
jgi:hypothetical protein